VAPEERRTDNAWSFHSTGNEDNGPTFDPSRGNRHEHQPHPFAQHHFGPRHGTVERKSARERRYLGKGDLHVDGSVEGLIQLEDGKLTVGPRAKVNADVVAREIVVYGSIKGNLRAHDRIEITKDGSVVGDLLAGRILIEDGASFKGSIEIDRKAEGERLPDRPAPGRDALKSS